MNREKAIELAKLFHKVYEELAPDYGYVTKADSAKPWEEVPENNRELMIATCKIALTAHVNLVLDSVKKYSEAIRELEGFIVETVKIGGKFEVYHKRKQVMDLLDEMREAVGLEAMKNIEKKAQDKLILDSKKGEQ